MQKILNMSGKNSKNFIEMNININNNEVGVLVAWNGASCDLKWIYNITQAPGSTLVMPYQIKYFLDPLLIIKHYKNCKLNPMKSKLSNLSLGTIWKYIMGKVLQMHIIV